MQFFIIGHHSSFLIIQSSYMNFHVESFILSFKNLSNLSFCDTVNQSFQPPTPPKIQQFSKLKEIYHFCQTSIHNMCIMYKIIVLQLDTRSLVLCVCCVDRCRSFCTFLLAIVLFVLLRYTDFVYPFGIFKLFLNRVIRKKVIMNVADPGSFVVPTLYSDQPMSIVRLLK